MEGTKKDKGNEKEGSISNNEVVRMPKNLRQVGNINDVSKVIYVEDYVMSYTKQLSQTNVSESKVAILLGRYVYSEDVKNIFISGAIEMGNVDLSEDDVFTDDSWTDIYVKIKEYFSDVEIIGWAIIGLGIMFDSDEKIKNIHTENFRGPDKVLLKFDNMEKEEVFYIVENNQFLIQKGYYIYYEKNLEMQNYMIDSNQKEKVHEEYEDIATKKIRNVIDEKETKKNKKKDKRTTRLTYVASTAIAVVAILAGSTVLRNYHQMKNLETTLNSLTENLDTLETTELAKEVSSDTKGKGNNEDKLQENSVDVETVKGNVSQTEEVGKSNGITTPTEETIKETDDFTTPPTTVKESEATEIATTDPSDAETLDQTDEATETVAAVNEIKYYIVREGDSLASISKELYSGVDQEKIAIIIELNSIEDKDKIYVGQQLIIP